MHSYSFERLEVWHLARQLVKDIYRISKKFPEDERFGLTHQIRKASISISSNIAEGSSRRTGKDQGRFTEIAFGSLMEVLNQLITAFDLEYIEYAEVENERPLIDVLANKLNKLHDTQMNK